MLPVLIVCCVLFAVCTLVEMVFLNQIRTMLKTRHPDRWQTLTTGNWIVDANRLQGFVWTGGATAIADPQLQKTIGYVRLTILTAVAVWVAMAGTLLTGHIFVPK